MQRLSGNAAGAMRHAATAPAAPHPAVAQRMRSTVARAVIIDPSGLTSGGQQGEPAAPGPGSLLADAPLPPGVVKVPVSELPKPHPKAQKTLSKSTSKVRMLGPHCCSAASACTRHSVRCSLSCMQTGVYQALVDTLNSVSFTVACDDPDLGWEVAQVRRRRRKSGSAAGRALQRALQRACVRRPECASLPLVRHPKDDAAAHSRTAPCPPVC